MAFTFDTKLPIWLPSERHFVGRRRELEHLSSAFADNVQTALISGPVAIGKTELAHEFLLRNPRFFPGGIAIERSFPSWWLDHSFGHAAFDNLPAERCILVVHDAETLEKDAFRFLYQITSRSRNLNLLLTSRDGRIPHDMGIHTVLALGPLSPEESADLLRSHLGSADIPLNVYRRLHDLAQGNPLVLNLAAATIQSGSVTWDEFFNRLSDFQHPGILGPDGKPIRAGTAEEKRIITDVTEVNDELLRMLRSKPELLRLMPPRKFEEVIARILDKLGYAVTLTPASGDGGFDVFAAKNDALGSFLFLVECKRYLPPNKVGVDIVRSLYGVVQSRKATAGIIATTSFFTSGANEFQKENKHQLHLRDYLALQEWLQKIRC